MTFTLEQVRDMYFPADDFDEASRVLALELLKFQAQNFGAGQYREMQRLSDGWKKAETEHDALCRLLKSMRETGWLVAIHNDYFETIQEFQATRRVQMTYWMFTKKLNGNTKLSVTSEGESDLEVVMRCHMKAQIADAAAASRAFNEK